VKRYPRRRLVMKLAHPLALCAMPLLACASDPEISRQELARAEVVTAVDTFWDWPHYVPVAEDELSLSGGYLSADGALVPADIIARTLAARLNERLGAGCPAAVVNAANAAQIDARWSCTLGGGAQSVALSGGLTTAVTTDDSASAATFTHSTTGLRVDDASIDATTTARIIPGIPEARFTHSAVITRGGAARSVDQRGDIALDDSRPGALALRVNSTRELSLGAARRTQTWRDVVFRAGVRLPISGGIRVEGAPGGVVDVSFANDGASEVRVDAVVIGSDGDVERFTFAVDPADNAVTLLR
jgi:hypothetical protein